MITGYLYITVGGKDSRVPVVACEPDLVPATVAMLAGIRRLREVELEKGTPYYEWAGEVGSRLPAIVRLMPEDAL